MKLQTQLKDVDSLISLHPNRQPGAEVKGAGRPSGTSTPPLLRSCVLLTYAAWEVYVEDSALEAATKVADQAVFEKVPQATRTLLAGKVKGDPWSLAGDGWRQVLKDQVKLLVHGDEKRSFGINTADPEQISFLHKDVFGSNLLAQCSWRGVSKDKVGSDLALLVNVRGAIAHKGQPDEALNLGGVEAWRTFVWNLGEALDKKIEAWLTKTLTA